MRIDWVILIAAVAVFVIALVLQSFVQMQVTATNVRRSTRPRCSKSLPQSASISIK
jgi:hypothetical protein